MARDLDLGVDLAAGDVALPTEPVDADAVAALSERFGLDSPVGRLRSALAG